MIQKITYENKEALQNDETIAEVNKVTDENMNEIKEVVNAHADDIERVESNVTKLLNNQTTQDAKIGALEEEQITQNEQLLKMEQEQTEQNNRLNNLDEGQATQDEEILALQQENAELKQNLDNVLISGQAEGEMVHLEDSANYAAKIEVQGNVNQNVTTQGNNILDLTKWTVTERVRIKVNSISANEMSLTNTSTDDNVACYWRAKRLLKAGRYYFSRKCEITDETGSEKIGLVQFQKVSDWALLLSLPQNTEKGVFTLTEDTEVYMGITVIGSNETGVNIRTLRLYDAMLSTSDVDYESFMPTSPTLDYPSEIQTVKDNVNFKACNKNIINIQPFTLTGGTEAYKLKTFIFSNMKAGTYTIQRKFTKSDNATSTAGMVQIYINNKWVSSIDQTINFGTTTLTENSEMKLLFLLTGSEPSAEESSVSFYDIQIEKGSIATDYVANQEQNYTVDIQDEMLENDKFDLENNKEVHTWLKLVLDGVNNAVVEGGTGTEGKYRYTFALWGAFHKSFLQCDTSNNKAYCSHLSITGPQLTYGCYTGFTVASNVLYIYTDGANADEFNEYLKTNPMTFYIPLRDDYYTKLDLTDNQKLQLEAIAKAKTYKNITNIYSTDEVGAILKVDYKKDLETLINNINNTLLGGN